MRATSRRLRLPWPRPTWSLPRAPALVALLLGGVLAVAPALAVALGADEDTAPSGKVLVLRVDDMINPVTERYLARGLDDAAASGAELVLIELDTPGGLLSSTEAITGRMLASELPIVVYVTPVGARAASAGTFITMAAHVAAMAPSTRIGAATPIDSSGQDVGDDLRAKVLNDTVAYARSIADARDRNADWAEAAVRDAVVLGAEDAVEQGVVDLVAADRGALLAALDQVPVATAAGEVILETRGVAVEERALSWVERLLMAIASPDIALLLLSLGAIALYFELANPGAMIPGITGIVLLVLGFMSLGTLPITGAGLALLILGLVLLGAELFVTSGGILGVGGVIAFGLGGLLLVDDAQAPFLEVSRPLLIGITVSLLGFMLIAMRGVVRSRSRAVAIGGDDVVGTIGEIRGRDVFVGGELWRAVTAAGDPIDLPQGTEVRIVARHDLALTVETIDAAASPRPASPRDHEGSTR